MKILVIGDSWSSAVCATLIGDIDHYGWPQIMGAKKWVTMFCLGVKGSTALQWATNFDNRLAIAKATPADVLIMSLLGNDVLQACVTGNTAALTEAKLAQGGKELAGVVKVAKKSRTIVMLYADPFNGKLPLVNKLLPLVNAQIKKSVAGIAGVEIFDTGTVLTLACFNGNSGHPNLKGHTALAKAFKQLLGI
jgi:lysophospholipase L1-like esterase